MEESVVCYICYDTETKDNSYLKEPPPCECKGSIVIHKNCLQEILKTSRVCTICKTKYKIQYLPSRNGLELITEVSINGDITEYTINQFGKMDGQHIVKKESGLIIAQSEYKNGLMNGEYKTWYSNGQLECQCYIVNNRIEGEYLSWFENGKLKEQSQYKNGLKDGLSRFGHKNTDLIFTKYFRKGEM